MPEVEAGTIETFATIVHELSHGGPRSGPIDESDREVARDMCGANGLLVHRLRLGLTGSVVAKEAGVSASKLYRAERNQPAAVVASLVSIARALQRLEGSAPPGDRDTYCKQALTNALERRSVQRQAPEKALAVRAALTVNGFFCTPREEKVLRARFCAEDGRVRTLREVAAVFDVSPERIRQVQSSALRKLRGATFQCTRCGTKDSECVVSPSEDETETRRKEREARLSHRPSPCASART